MCGAIDSVILGAGVMVWWLSNLSEDQSSVLSTHMGQLPNTWTLVTAAPEDLTPFSKLNRYQNMRVCLRARVHARTSAHAHAHTQHVHTLVRVSIALKRL